MSWPNSIAVAESRRLSSTLSSRSSETAKNRRYAALQRNLTWEKWRHRDRLTSQRMIQKLHKDATWVPCRQTFLSLSHVTPRTVRQGSTLQSSQAFLWSALPNSVGTAIASYQINIWTASLKRTKRVAGKNLPTSRTSQRTSRLTMLIHQEKNPRR